MPFLHDQGSAPFASLPGEAAGPAAQDAAEILVGKRILIVEDDPFITLALEEMLAEQGLVILAAARTVAAALRHAAEELDIALLDVNIGEDKIDPVADALAQRGVPFVFTTGCGRAGLPETHLDHAVVEKPFYIEEILAALRTELSVAKKA